MSACYTQTVRDSLQLMPLLGAEGIEAEGTEFSADGAAAVRRALGIPVHNGELTDMGLEAGSYGTLTFWHTLEHMRDPVACMERAFDLLSPGGLLVIETCDHSWPWARMLGNHWYFLDPPQHLFYFSAQGLKRLLCQVGFADMVILNKTDLMAKEKLLPLIDEASQAELFEEIVPLSAKTGDNCERLEGVFLDRMPPGPPHFPPDTLTDLPQKLLVAEIIREQVLQPPNAQTSPFDIRPNLDLLQAHLGQIHFLLHDLNIVIVRLPGLEGKAGLEPSQLRRPRRRTE